MTGKQRQDSTTSTLIPPQRSSLHSPTFSAPTSRESSVTRSPVTPRARQGTYHTFSQPSTSQALLVDPEAQQFLGVRGSSSGPDLASLRRRAEERRHEMNGSFVGTGKEGSSVRGTSTSPTINEDKHDADSGTGKDISREGTGGSSKGEPLRRAVGLQDFVFGEVIGRGSYSTVSAWDSCKSELHCSFSLLTFVRSFVPVPVRLFSRRSTNSGSSLARATFFNSCSILCRSCLLCAYIRVRPFASVSRLRHPSPTNNPSFPHSPTPLPSHGYLPFPDSLARLRLASRRSSSQLKKQHTSPTPSKYSTSINSFRRKRQSTQRLNVMRLSDSVPWLFIPHE